MATNFAFIVAIIAVNLLLGPLCLAVGRGERGSVALQRWGWGILVYSGGLLFQVAAIGSPSRVAVFLGSALVCVAPLFSYRAVVAHGVRDLDRRVVGAGLAVLLALLAWNNFGASQSVTVNVFTPTLVAIALFLLAALRLLARPPADARRAARFLGYSMLYAAALWSSRLLFLAGVWRTLASPERSDLVRSFLAIGHIVGTVASTFALMAIEVRKMERALTHTALTDALTGLANRRATTERFREEAARAQRQKRSLGMMVVDVDHFKRINDEHGHQVGDAALQQIAAVITRESRAEDFLGRIGGEEFLLLFQSGADGEALAVAERIRAAVVRAPLAFDGQLVEATVSIGLALLPADGHDWDALFAKADERLYQSKRSGRNRVTGPPA